MSTVRLGQEPQTIAARAISGAASASACAKVLQHFGAESGFMSGADCTLKTAQVLTIREAFGLAISVLKDTGEKIGAKHYATAVVDVQVGLLMKALACLERGDLRGYGLELEKLSAPAREQVRERVEIHWTG